MERDIAPGFVDGDRQAFGTGVPSGQCVVDSCGETTREKRQDAYYRNDPYDILFDEGGQNGFELQCEAQVGIGGKDHQREGELYDEEKDISRDV
jgi:hypothetical protein